MAFPRVRVFFWFIEKTESRIYINPRDGEANVRHREPERAIDFFEIPNEFTGLNITDGIGTVDDTCTVVYTEEAWNSFLRIIGTDYYPIFAVTVDNRFFGPYDMESCSYKGESRDIEIYGRIDREFEDTVIDRFDNILFSQQHTQTLLNQLLSSVEPFNRWNAFDSAYRAIVSMSVGQTKDLSGIRGALNKYGIGVSPRTIPYLLANDTRFVRDIDLYVKYPALIKGKTPDEQILEYFEAGFSTTINSVVFKSVPRITTILNKDIWRDSPPSFTIPDYNNAPGAYKNRRIDVAIKNIQISAELHSSGTKLPRLILDPGAQSTYATAYLENARWQLQNSAAKGSIKIDGNPFLVSGQIISIDEFHLQYPLWRIESVRHSFDPNEGHSSNLSLVLTQGLYNPDDVPRAHRQKVPLAQPIPVANPSIDNAQIPRNEPSAESYPVPVS